MRRVIGLTGYIGAGKTTAAEYLVQQHHYLRRPFARSLKMMLMAIGLAPSHVDGDLKNEPCDLLCGMTPRRAMQRLGTEWGRNLISPDLWTNLWKIDVAKTAMPIVADDVRFPNEAIAIREMHGIIIRIDNPNVTATDHQSETGIDLIKPDRLCKNISSIAELHEQIREAAA